MKLQPGDYVSTEGMSEEQYHAVCKAFMDAGAGRGEYGRYEMQMCSKWGWSLKRGEIYTCDKFSVTHFDRRLTIQQILGEPEQMNLQEAYKVMQANCGIEVGDTVRVLRKAENHENGWNCSWYEPLKNEMIGRQSVVKKVHDQGITLGDDNFYPFFILELVKKGKKLPDPIRISSEYKAMFREDGGIDVGCQRLSFDKLEEIYLTAKGVKES